MMLLIGRKRKALKRINSFTLVELLLVVVILGIFIGFSVPSFRKTYLNLSSNNTARNIAFLMRYAQARAIAERANYKLNFDSGNKRCWLEKESVETPGLFEKVYSRLARDIILPRDIKVEAGLNPVNFYPDGKIDSAKIYIICNNDIKFTISTQGQIGHVEISDSKK